MPKLLPMQCYLIQCDVWTGKVLTVSGKVKGLSDEDWIIVFESFEEADTYGKKQVSQDENLQCYIYDFKDTCIKEIFNEARSVQITKEPGKKWWQIWK